ncbi:hypothetical protein [Pedobacter jeongneungensis]|uniref:hypothetical protein n=1 Tax=Pedobacter jeongneungensis TaxID=947309 RepID=UPI0031EE8E29
MIQSILSPVEKDLACFYGALMKFNRVNPEITHDLSLHSAGGFHDPHSLSLRTAGGFYDTHDLSLHIAGSFHDPHDWLPPAEGSFHVYSLCKMPPTDIYPKTSGVSFVLVPLKLRK